MSHRNHNSCLILNIDYSPLCIIDWQKSITWYYRSLSMYNNHIEIISFHTDDFIQGSNEQKFKIPSIIRVLKYINLNNQPVKFSRKNLFIRDNFTCQYCGIKKDIAQLTYDHVIPKSQWINKSSPTNWNNIVTACAVCNRKKANRTPSIANMPLLTQPIKPHKTYKYLPITTYLTSIDYRIPTDWKTYLNFN
jgi:hypothetical protein